MTKKKSQGKQYEQQSLEATLKSIEKDFGLGSVQVLGDAKPQKIPRTSSGSYYIDDAVGGGYPKGRIIEIYGPESSGKCLTKDAMILTKNGYKTIEEIFAEKGLPMFTVVKDVEVLYPLINKDGREENTVAFTYNGKKQTYRIKTRTGSELKATFKHPLMVMDENGFMNWRYTGNVKKGDYIVTRRNDKISSGHKKVSNEEAYLLGALVADGHFGEQRVGFTNDDESIKDFFTQNIACIEEFNGVEVKTYDNGVSGLSKNYHLSSKKAVSDFYERVGITCGLAKDKDVPKLIRESSISTQKYFLMGYFDCECSIDTGSKTIEVSSASRDLLNSVKLMLKNMGIISFLDIKKVRAYPETDYWRLSVYGKDFDRYINDVGFYSTERRDKVQDVSCSYNRSNHDCIPNIQSLCTSFYQSIEYDNRDVNISRRIYDLARTECSRETLSLLLSLGGGDAKLRKILETYLYDESLYFDRVESVDENGEEPTFDFSMETTHSFIAESMVNHNTTVALHAIAEAQKEGGQAVFVDAENALDINYASALGVNIKDLILSQPDAAEEALQIVERFVRSGAVNMIVIDSVAALVPRQELEGEIGDNHIGLLARLMSQALRKLSGLVRKSNVTVIFINQIREKVGVMFGSPETQPGGRALKFYSSVRLDVRARDIEKKDGVSVSRATRIKTVKNKVAPPFREAEVDIEFGTGISKEGEIIDMGVDLGLIAKKGSWYAYNGNNIAQGRESAKEYLRENVDLKNDLDMQIREMLNPPDIEEDDQ